MVPWSDQQDWSWISMDRFALSEDIFAVIKNWHTALEHLQEPSHWAYLGTAELDDHRIFFYLESFYLLEEQPFRRCKYITILEKHHCQSQWWKGSSESHQEQKCGHEDQTIQCQKTSDTKIQRGSEFRFLQMKPDISEGWKKTFWNWLESQTTCAEHGEDIVLTTWLLTEAAEGLLNCTNLHSAFR